MVNIDWEFYLLFNEDIKELFNTEILALKHYNMYGKNENRIVNPDMLYKSYPYMLHFDHIYYRNNNKDLLHIDNKYTLIKHYLFQGFKEKRKINFNTSIYLYFNFTYSEPIIGPKLSIIMPIFNRPDILRSSIDSILNQTYKNIELIIVDDNSNIETKNIISQYQNIDKVTILTNVKNYGCYISINLALNLCTGTYITIHGSDDISLHDRFARLISNMINKKLLMCGNYILRSHFENFNDIDIFNSKEIFEKIITQNLFLEKHNSECCKPLTALGILVYHKSVFSNLGSFKNIRKGGDMVFFEKFLHYYEDIIFSGNDCSHRYLTKYSKGKTYEIIDEILYISSHMNKENITSQNIPFNINLHRIKE
jgi:glycosyltransferase involved in cell wall biosynthesis